MAYRENDNWRAADADMISNIRIPGYNRRAYVLGIVRDVGGCWSEPSGWNIGLMVHIGKAKVKDDIKFELYASYPKKKNVWKPIPSRLYKDLFKDFNDSFSMSKESKDWRNATEMDVETLSGHVLFTVKKKFVESRLWGLNLRTLYNTFPARVLDGNFVAVMLYLNYPGKIKSLDAAIKVNRILREIEDVEWRIKSRTFEKEKETTLERISKYMEEIRDIDDKTQLLMEKSADNLNMLSDKYGIEVTL